MSFIIEALRDSILALGSSQRLVVAFSGGVDSSVLLHALVSLGQEKPILAVHINHKLSPNAGQWVNYCQQFSSDLGVELLVEEVSVAKSGSGLEQAAREARYRVFENCLRKGDVLLMAHHQSDQAETVLYRLFRGAGVKGLKGIPERRVLGKAMLQRPLLGVSKRDIENYAASNNIVGVVDESNQDIGFDRNFIRHTITPSVQNRWPGSLQNISRTARHCQRADQLLAEYAREDLYRLGLRAERLGQSVDKSGLLEFSLPRRWHVVREWLNHQNVDLPEEAHLQQLEKMLVAKVDATPILSLGKISIRTYSGRIYCLPENALQPVDACEHEYDWEEIQKPLVLPNDWELSATKVEGEGPGLDPSKAYRIRFRAGGERSKPVGRGYSQTLKKLLQSYGLEPWLRDRIPLVYYQDELVAVGDLWIAESKAVITGAKAMRLQWRFLKQL